MNPGGTAQRAQAPRRAETAKRAVAVVFGVSGFIFASWVARLPAVRDRLQLTPSELGLLLLSVSVGSVSTMLVSGEVVHRFGPRRACAGCALIVTTGLAVAAATPPIPVLVGALVLVGCGTAVWDVAMNVEGAGVERLLSRPVMPRFHAGFSLGTVLGAGCGALAAAFAVPVAWHIGVSAAFGLLAVVVAVRSFLGPQVWGRPQHPPQAGEPAAASSGVLAAWREPRTLAIGLLALAMAMAEGSANDWLTVGLVDGYGVAHAVAALGLGVFVAAMTGIRMLGPWVLDRFGRVTALRGGALLVAGGVLAVVSGPLLRPATGPAWALLLAGLGAFAWGLGVGLGFPVAISAAADEAPSAAARVSVVSAIGYVAFLAGPPALGFLADRVGVIDALLGVGAAVLLSLATAGAARPLAVAPPAGG